MSTLRWGRHTVSKSLSFHRCHSLRERRRLDITVYTVEVAQPGRQGASLLLVSERSTQVKRPSIVLLHRVAVSTQADTQKP